MLTLNDINELTESHDGDIYSDLYKDVYGSRPRYAEFVDMAEFEADFEYLVERLAEQEAREKQLRDDRWVDFLSRIESIKQVVSNCSTLRACEILADAEDISAEERSFYGWEILEHVLGLEFNSIKPFLACEAQNEAFLKEIV